MDAQGLNSLKQTLERAWSNLKVLMYSKNYVHINFQILPNSLVFASGYINTGGHFLFLKCCIACVFSILSSKPTKPCMCSPYTFYWFRKTVFLSDEGPMLETLDYTIRIGSTPTFLYFDLFLYSAYAVRYVYFNTN